MNLAALFAFLLQSGACAPVDFNGQYGSTLTVLVCPMLKPIRGHEDRPAPSEAPKIPILHRT